MFKVIPWCCTHHLLNTYLKYNYLGIIYIVGDKNGKEIMHMEGLKTVEFSTIVVSLLYSTPCLIIYC